MCDDLTEGSNKRWLAAKKLGRREFNALSLGAAAAALIPGCKDDDASLDARDAAASGEALTTTSSTVTIETPDGTADAYFVHPESGRHPAVITWPDILGLREAFEMMATRLAAQGYAVLVVNQYYRTAPAPVLSSWEEWMSDEGKAKLAPNLAAISADGVTSDGAAFVEWLDKQSAVDTAKKVGVNGYCMGGPFTFRTAAAASKRVGAIASFHGANLVTDMPDSPHLLIPDFQAALLIAIAQNDDESKPEAKTVLKDTAKDADRAAEIEVYPAQHGWCAIDSAVYDEAQADKAYDRMLELYSQHL